MSHFLVCIATVVLFTTSILSLELNTSLLAYYIPTNQNSDLNSDTTVIGTYGYIGFGQNSLELEHDNVLDTLTKVSTQKNYIGTYTYYGLPYTRLRTGIHHIDLPSNRGNILILGAARDQYSYYGYKLWTVGCDAFASDYSGLNAYQIAPYFTTYFQPGYNMGWAELTAKTNLITLTGTSKKTMNHMETILKYSWNVFSLGFHIWSGESQYGVYEGGCVVYNSADTLRDGYRIAGTYYMTTQINLTTSYLFQRFEESTTQTATSFSKYSLMMGYHF